MIPAGAAEPAAEQLWGTSATEHAHTHTHTHMMLSVPMTI